MARNDSRQHPRYAVEVEATVVRGATVLPGRTRDVSRGGLCFMAEQELPLGVEVDVTMALVFDEQTYSEPIRLRARVVWCTPLGEGLYQVGTSFLGLTAESRAYLEMFLRYLREGQAQQEADLDEEESA